MLPFDKLTTAQQFLYRSHKQYQIIDGGRGTRKTTACVIKLHDWLWMYPGSLIYVFGQTLKHVLITFMEIWQKYIHHSAYVFNGNKHFIDMPQNMGKIYLFGADHPQSINRVLGSSITGIYLMQAESFTSESKYNDLDACIRLYGSEHPSYIRLMDTNPGSPSHWIYRRFIDYFDENYVGKNVRKIYDESGIIVNEGDNILHINIETNAQTSVYSETRINKERERMDELSFQRMYGGKWMGVEGVIYNDFSRNRHVSEFEPAESWTYYLLIDYGYTNPFCCLLAAVDSDNNFWIIDEHYVSKVLIPDHAQILQERFISQYKIRAMISDPSRPDLRMQLERELRIMSIIANNQVDAGIKSVMEFLKIQGNGKPRLIIHKRCQNLIRELESYQWDSTRGGNPKEFPLKQNDHACDALRYGIHTLKNQLRLK